MGSYQSVKAPESARRASGTFESPTRPKRSSTPSLNRQEMKTMVRIRHDYISNDYYIQYPSVGRGSYGEVFRATHKITGIVRAAKKIERSLMTDESEIMKEYTALKQLQHPNIIKMFEIYREEKFNYIVTEFCNGGQLFSKLAQEKRFSEDTAAKFMSQVFYGVAYCHMRGIIHGDLKPENILLDYTADPSQQVKIGDFGESRLKSEKRKLIFGTCLYRAPEVFKNKATEKCDVWSCGIMLYNLIVGSLPFKYENEAEDQDQIKQQIINGWLDFKNPNYEKSTPAFKDLFRQLVEMDPERRLSASEALHHKWFAAHLAPVKLSDSEVVECLANIREYCQYRDIELLCVHYICRYMIDGNELRKLAPIYKFLDSGLKGVLGKKELLEYVERVSSSSITPEDVEDLMERLGKPKDPTITFTEFTQSCTPKKVILTASNIEKLYHIADRKRTGKIGMLELQQCLGGTTATYERVLKEFRGCLPTVLLTKQEFQRFVTGQ